MTPTLNPPDLRRIGESAFTEVLDVFLSLPATLQHSSNQGTLSEPSAQLTSTVRLAGQRLTGSVHLQLPLAFVARAVHLLTGLERSAGDADPLLEDTVGELANMVAGRVAGRLAADGFPCSLGTPSVSRGAGLPSETEPGAAHGRTDLLCEGHWLSLEIQCRFALQ